MLSCLVPPRFGQEDKIMPSSTAFSLQFPSLASSLHHHNNNDDTPSASHANYIIKCPQCHQKLPGFQALGEHLETEHKIDKHHFDSSSNYHQNSFNISNNDRSSNNNSNFMIRGSSPSPPISTTPIGGASVPANLQATVQHHQQQLQHQRHQHAMAMAMAGMTRTSPPTSASANGYDEGGRSTSSPGSSTTLGDICGVLSNAIVGPGGPHACSQCSAAFPTRELLEKHELMHSPNTTVSCKVCHKTFANVYRLQRHMISHDESALLRKFKCTECDKAFKFKHHLKEHVRIHSGEKPFACDNCGKRFSHSGSYSSHMTSKKCMGLKLNNNRSIMKLEKNSGLNSMNSSTSKRGLNLNPMAYYPLSNVGLPTALHHNNNNNNSTSTNPNNNGFYPLLPKYSNYDAMNAALFASFQNPLYNALSFDPRLNPLNIHRLIELTSVNNSRLHSDPEDMIEEVTEDVVDEPKLVMDLEDDNEGNVDIKYGKSQPNSPENENYDTTTTPATLDSSSHINTQNQSANEHTLPKEEPEDDEPSSSPSPDEQEEQERNCMAIKIEDNTGEENAKEFLQCGRCEKKFNHQTELVQHEKVLCGLLNQEPRNEPECLNSSYFQSGSDEDVEDRESKNGSESERKVRVRTAITEEQQTVLKEHYAINSRPSREEFRMIANRLGLDPRVVQVWFQNNRSRERKMNNFNIGNKSFASPLLAQQSVSPSYSPTMNTIHDEQPLDLSLKKNAMILSQSPRYGIAPLQTDMNEAINLSRKSSRSPTPHRPVHYYNASTPLHRTGEMSTLIRQTPSPNEAVPRHQTHPYVLPGARGLVPMECLLQMTPGYARSQLLGMKIGERGTSLSPGSEKRSWRDDESRISHDDEYNSLMHSSKSLKMETNSSNNNPDLECPFVCDQCDKAFSKQSSLARHKYEHSGQRPYKCEECPKAFKHKHHLTEHKRLHSGEKPFQCTKCLKRFSHSGSYSQHMNHRYSYCKPYRE